MMRYCRICCLLFFILFFSFPGQYCLANDVSELEGAYKDYNVILIILDSLRPDHLGCYGYPKEVSPHIDALANKGVVFKNAYSQSSLTLPSIVSIFTSLYPFSHGVMHVYKDKLSSRVYTLAQILNMYGYETIWFGWKNDPHSGSAPGVLNGYKDRYQLMLKKTSPIIRNFSFISKMIREKQKKLFFITIHSYVTHSGFFPYSNFKNEYSSYVSKEVLKMIDNIRRKKWGGIQTVLKENPVRLYNIFGKQRLRKYTNYFLQPYSRRIYKKVFASLSSKQSNYLDWLMLEVSKPEVNLLMMNQINDLYALMDSVIFEWDNQFMGRLMEFLRNEHLDSKTIIIITADHGNEYGEHGKVDHGKELYDEYIHVPLIMYIPNLPTKTHYKEELVQSIDIFPTLLDLLGIPIPYQTQGISLVGLLEERNDSLINKYVYSQSVTGLASIRSENWKLIITRPFQDIHPSPRQELYNLMDDPFEKNNLIKIALNVAEELEKELDLKLKSLPYYQGEKNEFLPGIDQEIQDRIRKTGYW